MANKRHKPEKIVRKKSAFPTKPHLHQHKPPRPCRGRRVVWTAAPCASSQASSVTRQVTAIQNAARRRVEKERLSLAFFETFRSMISPGAVGQTLVP